MLRNLPPFCRVILLALAAAFLTDLLAPKVAYLLPLYGLYVFPGLQLWRLVTWPLYAHGLFSTAGAMLLIYFFGAELELIVHTVKLAAALAVAAVLGGIVATFLSPGSVIGGPEFIYLFILAGFTYLWPKREISVFGMFFVKTWIIALILFLLAILPLESSHLDLSFPKLFPPFFAALCALLFFHVSYQQYPLGSGIISSLKLLIPGRSKPVHGRDATWDDKLTIEHRIDAILDKISRKGMDSLSKEERDFLLKHSK